MLLSLSQAQWTEQSLIKSEEAERDCALPRLSSKQYDQKLGIFNYDCNRIKANRHLSSNYKAIIAIEACYYSLISRSLKSRDRFATPISLNYDGDTELKNYNWRFCIGDTLFVSDRLLCTTAETDDKQRK